MASSKINTNMVNMRDFHYPLCAITPDSVYLFIAAITCITSPFCAIFLIILYAESTNHSSVMLALLVGLCTGSLAYGVHTTMAADIYRYTNSLQLYRSVSLHEVFSITGVYSSVGSHGYNVIAWLVAQIGNDQLLRSIVVFSFYTVVAFIVDDYGYNHMWSNKRRVVAALSTIAIVPFINILSYAKSTIAFSVLLMSLYLDLEKSMGAVKTIALYIISATIHTAVVPVIALRALLQLSHNEYIVYLSAIFIQPIASFASRYVSTSFSSIPGMSIIVTALDRFSLYSEFQGWGHAAVSQSSTVLMGYRYFYIVLAIECIILVFGNYNINSDGLLVFGGIWATLCISISLLISADVFFRYTMPCTLLYVLSVMRCKNSQLRSLSNISLLLLSTVGAIVQLIYMSNISDIASFLSHGVLAIL